MYYGKVLYEEPAQSYVRALYESSRVPGDTTEEVTETTTSELSELDFYYMQNSEFLDAHRAYTELGGMVDEGGKGETPEDEQKQIFVCSQ